jgi:hypothetical protein
MEIAMSADQSNISPAKLSSAELMGADHPGAPHPHLLSREETRPEVIARLEWLDDLMFAALDGDATALQAASDAWHKTLAELGAETVEESRRQYLRFAQAAMRALRFEAQATDRLFATIEVISLLTGRAR